MGSSDAAMKDPATEFMSLIPADAVAHMTDQIGVPASHFFVGFGSALVTTFAFLSGRVQGICTVTLSCCTS
jgi:hypothetical protein